MNMPVLVRGPNLQNLSTCFLDSLHALYLAFRWPKGWNVLALCKTLPPALFFFLKKIIVFRYLIWNCLFGEKKKKKNKCVDISYNNSYTYVGKKYSFYLIFCHFLSLTNNNLSFKKKLLTQCNVFWSHV